MTHLTSDPASILNDLIHHSSDHVSSLGHIHAGQATRCARDHDCVRHDNKNVLGGGVSARKPQKDSSSWTYDYETT